MSWRTLLTQNCYSYLLYCYSYFITCCESGGIILSGGYPANSRWGNKCHIHWSRDSQTLQASPSCHSQNHQKIQQVGTFLHCLWQKKKHTDINWLLNNVSSCSTFFLTETGTICNWIAQHLQIPHTLNICYKFLRSISFFTFFPFNFTINPLLSLPRRLAVRGGNPMRPAVSSGGGQSPDHSISSLSSTSVSSFMDHSARGGGMEGDGEEDSWTDVETRVSGGYRVSGVQVGSFR